MNCRRRDCETTKNFESLFAAVAKKFNSTSTTKQLPKCITSLVELTNAQVSDTHLVAVLAAVAPNDANGGAHAPNDEFLQSGSYNTVSPIVKQCEFRTSQSQANNYLTASNVGVCNQQSGNSYRRNNDKPFKDISQNEKDVNRRRSECNQCRKYGRYKWHHKSDVFLIDGYKPYDNPPLDEGSSSNNKNSTVSFNTAVASTANQGQPMLNGCQL